MYTRIMAAIDDSFATSKVLDTAILVACTHGRRGVPLLCRQRRRTAGAQGANVVVAGAFGVGAGRRVKRSSGSVPACEAIGMRLPEHAICGSPIDGPFRVVSDNPGVRIHW